MIGKTLAHYELIAKIGEGGHPLTFWNELEHLIRDKMGEELSPQQRRMKTGYLGLELKE